MFRVFKSLRKNTKEDSIPEKVMAIKEAPAGTAVTETATFAAGCFWSVQQTFDNTKGVVKTLAGFTQGQVERPSYEMVCSKTTGHCEAVLVEYDPNIVTYDELLKVFFDECRPSSSSNMKNYQYRSGIYYANEQQKEKALAALEKQKAKKGKSFDLEVLRATKFYPAEEYHQHYLTKRTRQWTY